MAITLSAGDEVLIPDPGYTTFTMNAHMLEAVAVPYPLSPDAGFLPDIAELESLVTGRTKVIVINSPSNPLGTVFPKELLVEILEFARRHDLWIISDEVYEYFAWAEPHLSVAAFDTDNRVLSVFSFSQTYAMTGIRVGYLVTPPGLSATMRSVQEAAISCVNAPAQFAAIGALTGDQGDVELAREHYRSNGDAAMRLLDERGIRYLTPGGAFYLWIDVSFASGGNVADWAEAFLIAERVAVAPADSGCGLRGTPEWFSGVSRMPR